MNFGLDGDKNDDPLMGQERIITSILLNHTLNGLPGLRYTIVLIYDLLFLVYILCLTKKH